MEDALGELIASTPTCYLTPAQFFVSWQGVLTVAFRGLPEPLVRLKAQIESKFPALPKEFSGSKWPKITLGCLPDKRRITPEELQTLQAVIRCLEELISVRRYGFQGSTEADPLARQEEAHRVGPEEAARVQTVLSEADDPDYWFAASRDGNRESHYRGKYVGATLAYLLRDCDSRSTSPHIDPTLQLRSELVEFRKAVDQALPKLYAWFEDSSLHVTLRALCG